MNSSRIPALLMAVLVASLTACGRAPAYPESGGVAGRDAYFEEETPQAGGDAHYEADENPYAGEDGNLYAGEEPEYAPELEWGPVDADLDTSAVQPEWDAGEPVPDEIHIRVDGGNIYFSGTGTVYRKDYGNYSPIVNVTLCLKSAAACSLLPCRRA